MSFRFACPKCNSTHVTIHTDRHTSYGDRPNHFIKCTICAWMLYGDEAIEQEVERQQTAIERRQLDSFRVRKEPAAPAAAVVTSDEQQCAWNGCHNPRRNNSKYCSRECSNRNARSRYKTRHNPGGKKSDSEAA
jgi:hypothetical protein